MDNHLIWLQEWYQSHCNGDWEHDQRIKITTLDNPGWSLTINLLDTELENTSFSIIKKELTELDWLYCCVKDRKFEGRCGAQNLSEILNIFRHWAENNQ